MRVREEKKDVKYKIEWGYNAVKFIMASTLSI
jgi:hypothetical protein